MRKGLIVLTVLSVLIAGGFMFPPGIQPGQNTVYLVYQCPSFAAFLSRPDSSFVPRFGVSRTLYFPISGWYVGFSDPFHTYKAPNS